MALHEWVSLEITVASDLADPVAHLCHERGSSGVEIQEPATGLTLVRAYFPGEKWEAAFTHIKNHVEDIHGLFPDIPEPIVEVAPVKTENWATMWKEHFKPMQVGKRLVISPPWIQPDHEGKEIVFIEPAEAFGTGTHETTQGCLVLLQEALDQAASHSDDWTMLDVGCGSGILAIAASKLGLIRILAVDNDPIAVDAARKNANLNNVSINIDFQCLGLEEVGEPRDVVTANLDPKALLENQNKLLRLFKRYLIVSGVPLEKWDDVKGEFQQEDVRLFKEIAKSEWGCGLFMR